MTAASLLDQSLAAAQQDVQTVSGDGNKLQRLTEGVIVHYTPTHADERGSVFEIYDSRWRLQPEPVVFAHCCTIRPGYVKGWGLHKKHDDRHFVLQGEMELVLFDPRPESSTYGQVCKLALTEYNRGLVCIPKFVWHAEHNVGSKDVVLVDLPTAPYDHADPDKFRLPIDTPLIPYSFGTARGW
jgi:dTDP-4-dehydrorhamnose 3,5-epimerase